MRRLRPCINSRPPVDYLAAQRIDFLVRNTLISLLPGFALIPTGENLAVITAGEKCPARRLKNNRADMLIRQHGFLLLPILALLDERKDPVDGPDQKSVFARLAHRRRLTSG